MSLHNKNQRRHAREYALQALYQWHMSPSTLADLIQQFEEQFQTQTNTVDTAYWHTLVNQSITEVKTLDEKITPYLTRPLTAVTPIELCILRLAFCELCFCIATPPRVVINEAIELAKQFGATDSHRFINSIVDKAAHHLRATVLPISRPPG